jgi:DeoR/GlpR family transcriptional regulator of sugar metabolism
LSEDDLKRIKNLVDQKPDITLHEIIDQLHLKVSSETVRQALI